MAWEGSMVSVAGGWRYKSFLTFLIAVAFVLCAHLGYLYLSTPRHFPINTVKIAASFQRITRQQIATTISTYQSYGFFSLPIRKLRNELQALDWAEKVTVERIWPDILSIKLVEKEPIALWNDALITPDGLVFNIGTADNALRLPQLRGPESQRTDVLQIYQKLSKLLLTVGLNVALLKLHENQSWDLALTGGVQLHLGKQDLEKRLERFCKVYRTLFAPKMEQLASVDLRYERGMAVQWREQTGR